MRAGIEYVPSTVAEYYALPQHFTPAALAMMLVGMLPLTLFSDQLQNTFFTNLATVSFDAAETYVIAHGLNFVPAVKPRSWRDAAADFDTFERSVSCFDFFSCNSVPGKPDAPPPGCERFRIPNPGWHPDQTEWESSPGVLEYIAETRAAVMDAFEASAGLYAHRPAFNLQKRHRDALFRLKRRDDIVFIDADKNLGIVCLDRDDYIARAVSELQTTHHMQTAIDPDPLDITRATIQQTVLPAATALLLWAEKWVYLPHRALNSFAHSSWQVTYMGCCRR
eukprot:SAG11_NODE_3071_length_2713_cov_16.731446_2_plen_280_part_00